jgi:PilZ domain-containing protein
MASRLATAPATAMTEQPWLNRRVYIRRPCGPGTSGRVAGGRFRFRRAIIQDISLGGIALVCRQALRPRTHVLIQLSNEALGLTYDLSARVVHATRKDRDRWVIGCEFARELSTSELETLL